MIDGTNEETALAATDEDVLALDTLTLIGTVTGTEPARALLRTSEGTILTVVPGDQTPLGPLLRVAEDFVLIQTGPSAQRLTLPG